MLTALTTTGVGAYSPVPPQPGEEPNHEQVDECTVIKTTHTAKGKAGNRTVSYKTTLEARVCVMLLRFGKGPDANYQPMSLDVYLTASHSGRTPAAPSKSGSRYLPYLSVNGEHAGARWNNTAGKFDYEWYALGNGLHGTAGLADVIYKLESGLIESGFDCSPGQAYCSARKTVVRERYSQTLYPHGAEHDFWYTGDRWRNSIAVTLSAGVYDMTEQCPSNTCATVMRPATLSQVAGGIIWDNATLCDPEQACPTTGWSKGAKRSFTGKPATWKVPGKLLTERTAFENTHTTVALMLKIPAKLL